MDIFAHSVWTAMAAKKYNDKSGKAIPPRRAISIGWSAFWGVFPDLVAFGTPFLVLAYAILVRDVPFPGFSHLCPCVLDAPGGYSWISKFIPLAYQVSHSFVTFGVAFLVTWAVRKRAPIAMLGWALHIFIDIFSHAQTFFPTPFLWPISNWKFLHGVSWASPWFMIINYGAMLIAFYFVFLRRKTTER